MSAFTPEGNIDDVSETKEDFIKKVVELKGEHWSDPDTLAKGYFHAQQRIKDLEEAVGEAREQDYAKKLLEQLQQQAPASTQRVVEEEKGRQDDDKTSLTPEGLQSLIEKTLTDREKNNSVAANVSTADSKLTELYGTEAKATVQKKAKELGMSVSRLQEIAGESPTAFFRLIGEEPPVKETNSFVKGSVNTEAGFNGTRGSEHNKEYYTKLRRENRSLYNHPETQKKMMEDRLRLGDKFNK